MTTPKADAPLFVRLELTLEQQRTIWDQTGYFVAAIPIETNAASLRCRFSGLELVIPRGVFVPTSSSERTFELAHDAFAEVEERESGGVIVDVGTGAGAIALALAHAFPGTTVYGTDVSLEALGAARRNRARLGLRDVRFASGSLLSTIPMRLRGGVDLIVANVPYLPPDRWKEASRAFPEGTAIGPDPDGLGLVRQLLRRATRFLRPGGSLVIQLADFQWPAISLHAARLGYADPFLSAQDEPGPIPGRLLFRKARADGPSRAGRQSR